MTTAWAGTATVYDRSFGRLCVGAVPAVVGRLAGVTRPVLDAGTGTGVVAAALHATGVEAVGVDADPDMVGVARARHPGIRFSVAALPDLPYPDDAFGATVAQFVLNHVPSSRAAAAELVRVTRPGGVVAAAIWPSSPVSSVNALWNAVRERAGVALPGGLGLPPSEDFERSPAGLAGLLSGAGLVEVSADVVEWVAVVPAADLWAGVEAGIATIGTIHRGADADRRRALRAAFEDLTGLEELRLPLAGVVGSGTVPL